MHRYRIDLSYDGSDYFGWQRQPKSISLQETIEDAISKLFSNQPINVVGCGRTDTGVHAKHYVLHTDLPEIIDEKQFIFKLNRMLPESIAIHNIVKVSNDFHARFDAKMRTYRYFVHQSKDPFKVKFSWYLPQTIDIASMNKAAEHMLGKHDFTALSKTNTDVKTHYCEVSQAIWVQSDGDLYFEISADRFLRNMVRATVGTLVDVGLGKLTADEFNQIIENRDRQAASSSAPSNGLFLWKIEY